MPLGGMVLGGVWWITHRREEVAAAEGGHGPETEGPERAREMKIKFTFWKAVFLFLMVVGFTGTLVRFTQGPGTVDQPERSVPMGHLDRVRRSLRRDAGGRVDSR